MNDGALEPIDVKGRGGNHWRKGTKPTGLLVILYTTYMYYGHRLYTTLYFFLFVDGSHDHRGTASIAFHFQVVGQLVR